MAAAEAIVPLLLLAALILIHPVSIDLAVERFFAPLLVLFHKWAKLITAFVGIAVIAAARRSPARVSSPPFSSAPSADSFR